MKKIVFRLWAAALLVAGTIAHTSAAIVPASIFSDNAVLQQKQADPVWGIADPNEPIVVSINGQSVATTAAADGKWSVRLKPIDAGGPYTLVISGAPGDSVTLKNILVGEVWFCGGQSNMQYAMRWDQSQSGKDAIAASTDPLLHFIIVANAVGLTPQTAIKGAWTEATVNTVPLLTSVGYYFGRDLRKALNVPVGLIHDDYGGTPAQAWTSRDALEAVPILKHYVVEEAAYPSQYPALLDAYNTKKAVFLQAKAKYDIDAAAAKAAGTPAPTPPPSAPYSVPPYEKWPAGAAHLYNGMVAPVIPYGIRGVIWYQGESNNGRGYEYKTLFPTLINDWRKNWGQGAFPFLFVQLAPTYTIHPPYENYSWVDVREAQRLTLSVEPNTAMVVTTDIGDSTTVHPTRKEPVGHRLALAARALVYGEPLEYTGPMLGAVSIEGAKISVSFTHADGLHSIAVHDAADDGTLVAPADRLAGFEIAGSDHKYHAADAVILGSSVIVSSPDVPAPVAVRYGWANYPIANLSNNAGLPASPFKTDEWRWASQPTDK